MKKILSIIVMFIILSLAASVHAASYGVSAVSGTAVAIYTASSAASSIGVMIQNSPASTVNVYVGSDSSVTSSSYGYVLTPGSGIILNGHLNSWWVVTAGTAATVSCQLLF